jgi:hypothetical protein
MIPVKVGDKNMIDPEGIVSEFPKLNLGSLTAIDQKKPLIYFK